MRRLIVFDLFSGGSRRGLAGMVEVAAVHGRANASLVAGYGYTGILVAFVARQNPLGVIPVALLLGGIGASGGLLQRTFDLPDATVNVLQGILFMVILVERDAVRQARSVELRAQRNGSQSADSRGGGLMSAELGAWGVPLAVLAGAIRVSTPFMFVSLGECITESSGRVNLGLEGTLVMGAMVGYGVLVPERLALARRARGRARSGVLLGALHGLLVRSAARQRHRGRHRADAVRRRAWRSSWASR